MFFVEFAQSSHLPVDYCPIVITKPGVLCLFESEFFVMVSFAIKTRVSLKSFIRSLLFDS